METHTFYQMGEKEGDTEEKNRTNTETELIITNTENDFDGATEIYTERPSNDKRDTDVYMKLMDGKKNLS